MDDWEALADADVEKIEIKKETVNSKFEEEERLEKLAKEAIEAEKREEQIENQNEAKDQPKKEKKPKNKEVDSKVNEKTITIVDPFGVPDRKAAKPTADEKKRAEQISKESDEKNIADLFGASVENKYAVPSFLKDENEHINLANKVAQILEKSEAKIHVIEFFKQLLQGVYNKLGSKEYQEIYNKASILFNQKQKEEKPVITKKKGGKAPVLKITKATDNALNMGEEDEDFDEVETTYKAKYNEDDFM